MSGLKSQPSHRVVIHVTAETIRFALEWLLALQVLVACAAESSSAADYLMQPDPNIGGIQ